MSLVPLNFGTLINRMAGKGGMTEVGPKGYVYVKIGRIALRGSHLTDLPPGLYKSGSVILQPGEPVIIPLFDQANEANLSVNEIPLKCFVQIYGLVAKWRQTAGKHAKEVLMQIYPDADTKQSILRIFGEGQNDEFGNLGFTWMLPYVGDQRVDFKFRVRELLDFLFLLNECRKESGAKVNLTYSHDPSQAYNDNPLFLTWECFGRSFQTAHQIVPAEPESEKSNYDQADANPGNNSFLDPNAVDGLNAELVEDSAAVAAGNDEDGSEANADDGKVLNFNQAQTNSKKSKTDKEAKPKKPKTKAKTVEPFEDPNEDDALPPF